MNERLRQFLFPSITPAFLIRVVFVAVCAYIFFGFVCTPFVIRGRSMVPTYRDGAFDFLWKPRFLFSGPERGDVVAISLAGDNVVYLKRVVALGGDTVSFKEGVLYVDGKAVDEPYVRGPCHWNLPPRKVEPGRVYVVGDNRSMPMEQHDFGQVSVRRIVGSPVW
jgi:signal peptidase I